MVVGSSCLHPLIREWFDQRYRTPTPVQTAAWDAIGQGKHCLAIAPTGSGKTLAAFMDALSAFAQGRYDPTRLCVLYVSPLKALNEDIRLNLIEPLSLLSIFFSGRGAVFPAVTVATRSGDTPQAQRRRMLSRPPSILATTPESFSLILNSPQSRTLLSSVRLLIIDEVHALASNKRGSFLCLSMERLRLLCGDFQRVALSATLAEPGRVAAFIGGSSLFRDVVVIAPSSVKNLELVVEYPSVTVESESGEDGDASRHRAIAQAIARRIRNRRAEGDEHRTTLVFVDARRTAERMARLINEASPGLHAYAHHGSLSKDVRRSVERRLKEGRLGCVVATASLELGIDIGSVDDVALVGTPNSVAQALQRIGRSGHAVGQTSAAVLYPLHGLDLLRAAALCEAVDERDIDVLSVPENPLDVLAQGIVAICALDPWSSDALFDFVRRSYPFERLPRILFDSVLEALMERGPAQDSGGAKPLVLKDADSGILRARDGALMLIYSSGGAITDRGYYSLNVRGSGAKLGELDEEFVWERRIGDSFVFGTQAWKIVAINDSAVDVAPLERSTDTMPFWKAEPSSLGESLAARVPPLTEAFFTRNDFVCPRAFSQEASLELESFLKRQRSAFRGALRVAQRGSTSLPGTTAIHVELAADAARKGDADAVIIHHLRGRSIAAPLALALSATLSESLDLDIDVSCDNTSLLFELPHSLVPDPQSLLQTAFETLGRPGNFEKAVHSRLPGTGAFGAAFREAAERSLFLPKPGLGKRRPFWIARLRSKRLFERVIKRSDHFLVIEAFRTCLSDLFDMGGASELVRAIAARGIALVFFRTSAPSPFARGILWRETNVKLYESDQLPVGASHSASDRAISMAIGDARARLPLSRAVVESVDALIRRESHERAPEDLSDLFSWLRERIAIPEPGFEFLLSFMDKGLADDARKLVDSGKIVKMLMPGAEVSIYMHPERVDFIRHASCAEILGRWLVYSGSVRMQDIISCFAWPISLVEAAIRELSLSASIIADLTLAASQPGSDPVIMDAAAYGYSLRRARAAARPSFTARPASHLAPFLAGMHGLNFLDASSEKANTCTGEDIERALENLEGMAIRAEMLETDILPDRMSAYVPSLLDSILEARSWLWFGSAGKSVSFSRSERFALFARSHGEGPLAAVDDDMDFIQLRDYLGLSIAESVDTVWNAVWETLLSSDSLHALRSALAHGFKLPRPEIPEEGGRMAFPVRFGGRLALPRAFRKLPRSAFLEAAILPGRWFGLELGEMEGDDVDEELMNAERTRIVVGRHGIVCRETLAHEPPALSWRALYPSLRRLELSGELVSGLFIENLSSPQFMTLSSLKALDSLDAEKGIFALSALDPASICGCVSGLGALGIPLPARSRGNRLVYRGDSLIGLSCRSGKDISIMLEPGDEHMPILVGALAAARHRAFMPQRKIPVATINGLRAASSPYADAFVHCGFETDRGSLTLW